MKRWPASPAVSLFAAMLAALLTGSFCIYLNNRIIHGMTFAEQWSFHIPLVAAGDALLLVLLGGMALLRLSPVRKSRNGEHAGERMAAFRRLLDFPLEWFAGLLGLSLILIFLFHAVELAAGRISLGAPEDAANLAMSVIAELNIALMLSVLLYVFSRRLLRTQALRFQIHALPRNARRSAAGMLSVTAAICFVIVVTNCIRVLEPGTTVLHPALDYLLVAGLYSVLATGIFALSISESRKELRLVADHLRRLASGGKDGLHQMFPVIALDETGWLTGAWNQLQQRIKNEYEQVERNMKLAHAVQNRLLPLSPPPVGGAEIASVCRQSSDVGGDFHDWLVLPGNRLCLAVGDVSGKGLPAALLMCAVMAGFRSEAAKGGSPGDLLTRLNRHVHRMTRGESFVTMAVAVLDTEGPAAGTVTVASAGHLDPIHVSNRHAGEWAFSSLPLGITPDAAYRESARRLGKGDVLVFLTDGIVECRDDSGHLNGFDWILGRLSQPVPSALPLASRVDAIMDELDGGYAAEDDRTLLALRWHGDDAMRRCFRLIGEYGAEKPILRETEAWIRRTLPEWPRVDDLLTVLSEMCLNAIEHGLLAETGRSSPVQVHLTGEAIRIRVWDCGDRQPAPAPEVPPADKWRQDPPRGWGLYLINRLADGFGFGCDNGLVYAESVFKLDKQAREEC
jgi:serine phosphatase RsbU (regulator of sigma subunit)/anti-sigma regulatory factor (Ser/Thr protein kinase)